MGSYAWSVPVDEVAAGDLRAGDVVRLDDPQAHRVERAVLVDGRVVVELRPVGLDVPNAVRVTLPVDRLVVVSARSQSEPVAAIAAGPETTSSTVARHSPDP